MKRFVLFVLLLCLNAHAQTPNAVIKDPPQKTNRALAERMVELQVPATNDASSFGDSKPNGELMNGIFYLAAGAGPHPTVILFHGFPGNEQNLDLAQSIRRAGWNVLYYHYRGAWGSQGDFSFSNAMQDATAGLYFLHDPANVKKYNIDLNRIVLIGHSMGGFMAAYAALHGYVAEGKTQDGARAYVGYGIAGLVLISPWNLAYDAAADKDTSTQQLAEETTEWRGYEYALHGFTAESGMEELRENADQWDLIDWARNLVGDYIPVLLTYGKFEDDREEGFTLLRNTFQTAVQDAIDSEEADYCHNMPAHPFTTVVLPTDHAYSDQRIALQSASVNWLGRFKPRTSKAAKCR